MKILSAALPRAAPALLAAVLAVLTMGSAAHGAGELGWKRMPDGSIQISVKGVTDPKAARERIRSLAPTQGVAMCDRIEDVNDRGGCILSLARLSANPSICGRQDGAVDQAACIRLVAVDNRNPGFCDRIDTTAGYDIRQYRDACYGEIAVLTGNIAACERAGELAGQCIVEVAAKVGDPSICRSLGIDMDRDICVTEIAKNRGDASICEKYAGNYRNPCLHELAKATGNRAICERIPPADPSRQLCLDDLRKFEEKSIAACASFQNKADEQLCLKHLAMEQNDPSLCHLIEAPPGETVSAERDECFVHFGKARGDARYCEQIGNPSAKDRCMAAVAYYRGDAGLCEQVRRPDLRDICIAWVAILRKDSRLCGRIVDEKIRRECLARAAKGDTRPLVPVAPKPAPVKPAPSAQPPPATQAMKDAELARLEGFVKAWYARWCQPVRQGCGIVLDEAYRGLKHDIKICYTVPQLDVARSKMHCKNVCLMNRNATEVQACVRDCDAKNPWPVSGSGLNLNRGNTGF